MSRAGRSSFALLLHQQVGVARTDWSAFEQLPLFRAANRINAYNTYLLMEQQGK